MCLNVSNYISATHTHVLGTYLNVGMTSLNRTGPASSVLCLVEKGNMSSPWPCSYESSVTIQCGVPRRERQLYQEMSWT